MSEALLLLNGPAQDKKTLRAIAKDVELIACADGGLKVALEAKLTPDIVIGDMDSRPKKLPKLPETVYLCDFDEDRSDFEKSLEWLKGAGFEEIFISGVRGGRVDHERVNWSVVRAWSSKLEITVIDGGITRLLQPGHHRFPCSKGRTVSLVADTTSAVVSTKGLHYQLKEEKIRLGSRGLSNQCLRKTYEIQVHSGRIWMVYPDR